MKRIGLIVAFGAFAAASAYAQQTYEPAVPRGLPPDSRISPAGELPQPAAAPVQKQVVEPTVPQTVKPSAGPRLVQDARRRHPDRDVRQCLQFTSNRQVHRCAEPYSPRHHHARVTKTTAKSSEVTIKREDRAKAADIAKPDMSKAAEPAKPVETTKAAPAPAPAAKAAEPAKSAAAPAEPAKPKWTDTAKKASQNMYNRGTKEADDAGK